MQLVNVCTYYYLLLFLARINRSRLQWSAMYGLGGNTTRISQADENLINSFCVQEIIMVVNYLRSHPDTRSTRIWIRPSSSLINI